MSSNVNGRLMYFNFNPSSKNVVDNVAKELKAISQGVNANKLAARLREVRFIYTYMYTYQMILYHYSLRIKCNRKLCC